MKQRLRSLSQVIPLFILLVLSGCSTLSPKSIAPQNLQENLPASEIAHLNDALNTAIDNQLITWQSEDGDTTYQITTYRTHVNSYGEPCRYYSLLIDREYHRKIETKGMVCRGSTGNWQDKY